MTPERLAQDLQRALTDLQRERERSLRLAGELDHQSRELERLRHSVHRESNSRFLAEEALDETRDRLHLAVEAAGLALWDWAVGAPQVFLSARWGELVGDVAMDGNWRHADLMGRVHPEDLSNLKTVLTPMLYGQVQRAAAQFRLKAAEGWVWVEAHAMVAERDNQGAALRLMGTLADIGAHKRVEAESARARELAEQANRAKSEFLANISHEVRTPLNALMGLTRMLMDSPLSPEQKNWLALMDSSAQSLLTLLNDILDLSRIEAGKLEIENTRFDLPALLKEAVGPYAEQARGKPLEFTLALTPELPQWVMGDPGRLRQVVGNLLSNAIKFTPRGGHIELRALTQGPAAGGARRLLLQVQGSGVGIARKQQGLIFEAFTQADASTARRHGGSGLGLAICAKLTRLMGGEITLNSELGQGSTFTVSLPLTEAAHSEAGPLSAPIELMELAQAGQRYAGLVVLLAEDHPVNELMMRQLLLRLGCTVRVARGGAQAVALWEQGGVELVLMDVQMPGVSGLEATKQIRDLETRRRLIRTPIIAVTANAMAGDRETCLAAGMDGYASKPVSPQALMREMDRVLQARRLPTWGMPTTPAADAPLKPPTAALAGPLAGAAAARPAAASPEKGPRTGANSAWGEAAITSPDSLATSTSAAHPKALDVDKLRRRLDGDESTLQQLALAMRNDLVMRQRALQVALAARDTASAVAHAHGLKGSLGSMTAERGARLAKGLELAARAEDWQLFERALPLMQAEAKLIDATLSDLLPPNGDLFESPQSEPHLIRN